MFQRCDMGMAGRVWPDGRAYLDQPMILIEAFSVIAQGLHDFEPEKSRGT